MQCYTELTPPTAVSHAIQLPFLSPRAHNLVVAKNSLLQIFELKSTVTEVSPDGGSADNGAANVDTEAADVPLQRTEHTSKLVLVAEFPLAGTVISLARIKALDTKSRGEALLVAFRDAKLSLVEWDPETFNLQTISVHYYENPDLAGAPWAADLGDTYNFLTADPSSRCAALKFGAHNLAILPFRQRDLAEDDYDSETGAPRDEKADNNANGVDEPDVPKTPYSSSYVLPLTHLDPALTHPVHLAFLYEYREPTFGVVGSSRYVTPSLMPARRDILTYTVFTLDLEQKASTTLLSVPGLPYDIFKVVPLSLPIGGALLLGANEIIHVDQAGKTNGVAVNEFAKLSTSFPLSDQSDLALQLEGCAVEPLSQETGDLVVFLKDGRLLVLTFTLDGRTVSSLTLQPVAADQGGHLLSTRPSCTADLGRGKIFVGSEDGDSVMLGWTSKLGQAGRKRSQPDIGAESTDSELDDMEDDMDDDLYNNTTSAVKKVTTAAAKASAPGSYTFRLHDVLPSLAPIRDVVLHTPGNVRAVKSSRTLAGCGDLVLSTGRGSAGGVTTLNREMTPTHLAQSSLESARGIWAVHAKKQSPTGLVTGIGQDAEANMSSDVDYDQYLVVCKAGSDGTEHTVVYQVNGNDIEESQKGDFEREDASTINVGTLAGGTKIVQVMRSEIKTYNSELNMDEMFTVEDEETGEDLQIINASFADPYLLILREDSSVKVFKTNDAAELEDIDASGLTSTKWLTASLFKPSVMSEIYALLLTQEGGLRIFAMSAPEKASYSADGLVFLPPFLTEEYSGRRSTAKATIMEILAADIGDATSKSPHLIARTSDDNLVIYKAFHYPARSTSDPWTKNLRWVKLPQPHLPKFVEEPAMEAEDAGREGTLIVLNDVCGYSTVFQRGTSPSFILKEASSAPRVIDLAGKAIKSLTRFHTSSCQRGFAYIDADDILRISQLPAQTNYGHTGWATRRQPIGSELHAISYHPRDVYVIGTGQTEEYMLADDTYHYDWKPEDIAFKPHVEQGVIKVLDAKTLSVIDTHVLEPQEEVLCIKTLNLEFSETTHERRSLIAVGTAIVRGEDLATKGNIRIFEVITVVPEPDRPETNRRLRLVVKDEVKGAVSAISELGTQGFLIMAQGQKAMVRGLKEDGTLLPVAFMDMQCYVTELKSLPNSGMLLMGDAYKGLWFTGYTEEPYKMMMFGRSNNRLEVLAADFLPFEKQLHIIVADADMNLQVLQFDPENPKSLGGLRLLHKSTFHTGHFPVTMHLLQSGFKMPQTSDFLGGASQSPESDYMDMDGSDADSPQPLHQILHTSQSGTLALITPLSESSYKRLSDLATFLSNSLDSACGLNARAFRAVEADGAGASVGGGQGSVGASRSMVDGNLLMRWGELGEQRRRDGMGKVGGDEWVFRGEREVLIGRGIFGSRG